MKLSGECANFEIDTGSVTTIADQVKPFIITNTVNMRTVLGDMFYKYNKFYIVFNGFAGFAGAVSYTTLGTGSTNVFVWALGMSGDLRFLSNTVNGQTSSIGYFPLRFTMPVSGYGFSNATITNGIVFEKPNNEIVTINIAPYLTRGGAPANISSSGQNQSYDFNFSFTIYGLSE